jgi:rhodanese-related sulfurtransferase
MTRIHTALLFTAAWAGLAAAATGPGSGTDAARLAGDISAGRDHISAPQLAERLMAGDSTLRLFDLRSTAEFEQMHIPTAQHASIETLLRDPPPRDATIVVYSVGGAHAAQAWVLLRLRGYQQVFVLREGLYEWIARVIEPRLAADATPAERTAFDEAARYSRFFGGLPRAEVARAEVPVGYWTGQSGGPESSALPNPASGASTQAAVAGVRRRGC